MAFFDDEQIVAGAFGNEAFGVEHDGFFATGIVGFDLGQNIVEVIERLNGRIQRAVEIASGRDGDDVHATLVQLGRIKLNLVCDDDDRRIFAAVGIETERSRAACDNEANVTVANLVLAAGFNDRPHHLLMSQRDIEQQRFGGVKEPIDVLLQLEDAAVIGANALEDAIAVQQAVIENGNFRIALAVIFAINVNFHARRTGNYETLWVKATLNR